MRSSRRDAAQTVLRGTGARVTPARLKVLALLLREPQALTHREIERRLGRKSGLDRVTLYRVLEWLVKHGLAHRIAAGGRAWRFDAVDPHRSHRHAHFECGACGTVTCLESARRAPRVRLPAGFRPAEVELTVKGTCADCGSGRGETSAGKRPFFSSTRRRR